MRAGKSLVATLLLLLAGSAQSYAPASPPDYRGIFVYTLNIAVDKSPDDATQMMQAISAPGVDGITLVLNWSTLEPAHGVFQWDPPTAPGQSLFDQWIRAAKSAGKKVNLAIRAGEFTPCWLFQSGCPAGYSGTFAGATMLGFQSSPHQGQSRNSCETVNIAAPWDATFLHEWDSMLAAVAQHLHDIGAYNVVSMVRLTGINRSTDEFRLPEEILAQSFQPPDPCTTNSISTWLAAGYRPSKLLSAWDSVTTSFKTHFPGKTFNLPIIPVGTGQGQFPFPEIDENGCVYSQVVPVVPDWSVPNSIPANTCTNANAVPDQNEPLLELAAAKFPGQFIVEFENLESNRPASSTVIAAAVNLGAMTAFMTNNYFAAHGTAGAACSGGFTNPQHCPDSPAYLALVEVGIFPQAPSWNGQAFDRSTSLRSQFIEVFAPDVDPPECDANTLLTGCGYPGAIRQAHAELVDTTPPVIAANANPAVLWPPQGQMVQVTVSGTMTDDLSGVNRGTATFDVHDQYGAIQASGPVTVDANGNFSFPVALQAQRNGADLHGRVYTIKLAVQDLAGNIGTTSVNVVVPHDLGN